MSVIINLDKFYNDGFCSVKLTSTHYKEITNILKNQNWIDDEEKIYTAIPDFLALRGSKETANGQTFDSYNKSRQDQISRFPIEYKKFIHQLFLDPMITGDWQEIYDLELRYLDLWDGAENTPWHFEGSSDADIVFLIYLNDEGQWQPEWGGQLEVGERKMLPRGIMSDFSQINLLDTVLPNNRTLTILNNKKVNCVHRSLSLEQKKQRIVLTGEIKLHLKSRFDKKSKFYIEGL